MAIIDENGSVGGLSLTNPETILAEEMSAKNDA